jgi:hypothetical protein
MKALAALIAAALTACASSGNGGRSDTAPLADADVTTLAASGDSVTLAKVLRSACRPIALRADCYERYLAVAASTGHVKVAMGALGQMAAADPGIRRDGHVYAHAIGIAAGQSGTDIASTFTQCSESFQSGCYHGIIQARFADLDRVDAAEANALCAPFRSDESKRWIRFQCVHGMGHGLTMLYDHDLRKGLAGCDLLEDLWDRHSCYSGAFMENVVNVTMPHHPASRLAHHGGKGEQSSSSGGGLDGMPGMKGMNHESATAFEPVDPADQQYPCSRLAERYLSACYEMQTSVMLYNNKGNIADAAKSCDNAPPALITTCYASLGRDVSSYSAQDHAQAIRMCSLGTPRYQPWCYYGLVKNFVDLNARPEEGLSLCRDVPSAASRMICYTAVGEQIRVLGATEQDKRSMCAPAEPAYLAACLYGASVTASAPAALLEILESARK